jgi:hypothetical protein
MAQKRKHKSNADKQAEYRHRKKAAANVTLLASSSVRVPAPHNRLVSGGMGTRQLDIISGASRGAAHGRVAFNAIPRYTGPQTFDLAELCGLDPKEQFFKEMTPWFTGLVSELMDIAFEEFGPNADSHMVITSVYEAAANIVRAEIAKPEEERAWQNF